MQQRVIGAFRQVVGFLVQGMDFEAENWRAFEGEMREIIAPHMKVLAHRRAKLLDGSDGRRWSGELETFMDRSLWPLLGDERGFAERNRVFVALMLDVAIAEEQVKAAARVMEQPAFVRSFDGGWAG